MLFCLEALSVSLTIRDLQLHQYRGKAFLKDSTQRTVSHEVSQSGRNRPSFVPSFGVFLSPAWGSFPGPQGDEKLTRSALWFHLLEGVSGMPPRAGKPGRASWALWVEGYWTISPTVSLGSVQLCQPLQKVSVMLGMTSKFLTMPWKSYLVWSHPKLLFSSLPPASCASAPCPFWFLNAQILSCPRAFAACCSPAAGESLSCDFCVWLGLLLHI